ncbi:MAG: signal peptidase I [Neglectibacter sp.]
MWLYWQNKLLLKRIIGGPGDVISIDTKGVVSVNGEVLDEPYVDELALGECDIEFPYQVPESRYFAGDHRVTSIDSRVRDRLVESQIVGKVFYASNLVRFFVGPLRKESIME